MLALWNSKKNDMGDHLDNSLDQFFPRFFNVSAWDDEYVYPYTTKRVKDGYQLRMNVPGFSKDDIQVSVEGGRLKINGVLKEEKQEFEHSFTLSDDIDSNKIEAKVKDGVLLITLPEVERVKPKQITVS